jgi:hypothetical protein
MNDEATCSLCGHPMPPGEEMFKYHGYTGPCPVTVEPRMRSLQDDLAEALNRYSAENGSNTPDFILAQYLTTCLGAFDAAVQERARWYGRMDTPGGYTKLGELPQDDKP